MQRKQNENATLRKGLHCGREDERPQLGAACHQHWVLRAAIQAGLSSLPPLAARMATPASAPDTRALVADFVGYKLRQKGYVCGAGPGEGPAADPLHQAMRAAGDEFETRFRRTFSDLAAQLHVTPGSAQQRFTQAEFTALYGDGALEEARRLREGNWASVRTVLTGAVALGALVTVGAFFASK
ncbi:hypothetical protein STEG23_009854 [Scotinomys teguina]